MRRQAHTARLAHAAAAAAAAAGLLTVSNGSAAEWAWMRNQDRQAMASDQVSMLKDSACPAAGGGGGGGSSGGSTNKAAKAMVALGVLAATAAAVYAA